MTAKTVAEATFEVLRRFGVDRVFGNPGSTELRMFAHWPDGLDYVVALQEASSLAMADGYAQRTGRPGFVNLHSAAGLGNAMGSVVSAARNNTPLIITAGQQTRAMLLSDPFLCSPQATMLPAPYVKWAIEPARAADVPTAIMQGLLTALTPPRGPVFVSIPEDDWDRDADPVPARSVAPVLGADPDGLAHFAAVLDSARTPAIVVGQGADASGCGARLVELAEKLQAAVYEAPYSARCSFPQRHRLFQGFLGASRERVVSGLEGHDVILVVGAPVFTYHIDTSGPYLPEGARVLHLTDDPARAVSAVVGESIVCSPNVAVDVLVGLVAPVVRTPPAPWGPLDPGPMTAPLQSAPVARALSELLPDDAVVFTEAPSYLEILRTQLRMKSAGRYHSAFSGSLGWALPAAVGGAMANDKSYPTVCVIGDGSMMYSVQALWTAVQHEVPLTVVVFNNGEYSALKGFESEFGITRFSDVIETGLDLPGIDLVAIAAAMGVSAQRASDPDTLSTLLAAGFRSSTPTLIDVPMQPLRGVSPV